MLKIRLRRIGKRNQPEFRIVLVEAKRSAASGKFIENLGYCNPRKKIKKLNEDRIKYWFDKGVRVSPTAHNIFVEKGVIKASKIKIKIAVKNKKGEEKIASAVKEPIKAPEKV